MRAHSSALRKAGLAAGAVVLLAGCGGRGAEDRSDFGKDSATDILTAAATDMQALKTVRMAGRIEASGQQIGFDLQLTTQGDCQGTFKVGDGSAQITLRLLPACTTWAWFTKRWVDLTKEFLCSRKPFV